MRKLVVYSIYTDIEQSSGGGDVGIAPTAAAKWEGGGAYILGAMHDV